MCPSHLKQSQISQPQEIDNTAADTQHSVHPTPPQSNVKYFQDFFFRDIPNKEPEIVYYIHHLVNQTPMSSLVKEQVRENFAQYKHLKEKILPQLSQIPPKTIDFPQPKRKQGWKTLVLDLDETLIHCVDGADYSVIDINQLHDINLTTSPDSSPLLLQISLRPGLADFISEVTELFEVIVFTASEKLYAIRVLELINQSSKIDGILSRENCIALNSDDFVKDLSILNRKEIIIVDNSLVAVKQTEQLIPIVPFYGDETDRQLFELLPYLRELSSGKDIISINKEMFLWETFLQAQKLSEYYREIRKCKGKARDD